MPSVEPLATPPAADRGVVGRALQAAAASLVLILLALLVWKVVGGSKGADLDASIRNDEQPRARRSA